MAQKAGERNWQLLKVYPWLTPFAWIYQFVRWIKRGLESKLSIKSLGDATDKSNKVGELLDALGVAD